VCAHARVHGEKDEERRREKRRRKKKRRKENGFDRGCTEMHQDSGPIWWINVLETTTGRTLNDTEMFNICNRCTQKTRDAETRLGRDIKPISRTRVPMIVKRS